MKQRSPGAYVSFLWLVLVVGACSPTGLAPSAIAIEPGAMSIGVTEETDLAAVLAGGAPFGQGTVRWAVDPIELGTVDARGHFIAGPRSGTGSVTATLGTLSATAHVTVSCPTTRSVRDISFNVWCTDSADVYVEARIAGDDAAAVAALAESDTTAVQQDVGRTFRTRALVYVFADASSYIPGVRRIFGERTGAAAMETDAFFAPWVDAVALDWREVSRDVPITGLRHELTHRLVWQITGSRTTPTEMDGLQKAPAPDVPAWLDEGLAHVEESTLAGAGWMSVQDRTFAATVSRNSQMSLSELADLTKWNARTGDGGFYQYLVAAETVRLLQADLGQKGVVAILERIRDGATFRDAYRTVAGSSFEFFAATVGQRIRASVTPYPGIAAAPRGKQSLLMLYGFTPRALVTFSVTGPAALVSVEHMDAYGNGLLILGSGYPAGSYSVGVVGGDGKVRPMYTFNK
ncbi:MAG TPA: hypothetical protein VGR46_13525 [Candidatus Limnocylindria bacterium]|jgi:hypothetical protein|nr:hypothetical protein [Candidatus Limnocylindria bacterium]